MLMLATFRTSPAFPLEQRNLGASSSATVEVAGAGVAPGEGVGVGIADSCDDICESTDVLLEDGRVCSVSEDAALTAARLAAATDSLCIMAAAIARIADKRRNVNKLFSAIDGALVRVDEPDVRQRPSTPRRSAANSHREVMFAEPATVTSSRTMRRIDARDMSPAKASLPNLAQGHSR